LVSESRVTWATSVPILVLPVPLCSRLRSDVRDRPSDRRQAAASLNAPPRGRGIISHTSLYVVAAAAAAASVALSWANDVVQYIHRLGRAGAEPAGVD